MFGIFGEWFYPGPGHAIDNSTVWLEESGILFGGCLVRSSGTDTLKITADADMENWPQAVAQLQQRYRATAIVVPGTENRGG